MEINYDIKKTVRRFHNLRYKVVLEGIGVGAAAGIVVVLFRFVLAKLEGLVYQVPEYVQAHPWLILAWILFLLLAAGGTALLLKWEPMISGSGIPQVDGELQGFLDQNWWRIIIAKFAGGILTIGSGLSLGREGPSIQLGAMAGKGFAKLTKRMRTEEKLLITCGASAGLAAAFNAPLAGALFSLEEVHKSFSVEVLLSSLAASVTADFISKNIFGLGPVFDFSGAVPILLSNSWAVILLGLLIGILGVFHNFCIRRVQEFYDKIVNSYVRTLIPFGMAGILVFVCPVVLGGGHHLIMAVSDYSMPLNVLCVVFLIKFVFSVFSFSSGVPGGIFLPLLVMGSAFGGIFHGVAAELGLSLNLQELVILGMACSFSAIVRAPVTGILLITEMTGNFSHLLFLAMASLTAYIAADLLGGKPIYEQLLRRMINKTGKPHIQRKNGEKILIEIQVQLGAGICEKRIREINLPERCLIISVKRGEEEMIPQGDTIIQTGDVLTSLCDEYDGASVQYALEKQCRI